MMETKRVGEVVAN